jgi:hypothetical protein
MDLHHDSFVTISRHPDQRALEMSWTDATASMTDDDFKNEMTRLAELCEREHEPNVLIDVTHFLHQPSEDVGTWRETNIVPRYNAAGVEKFAFLVPPSAPSTVEAGSTPQVEGVASYPTGYFGSREMLYAWFAGSLPRS